MLRLYILFDHDLFFVTMVRQKGNGLVKFSLYAREYRWFFGVVLRLRLAYKKPYKISEYYFYRAKEHVHQDSNLRPSA